MTVSFKVGNVLLGLVEINAGSVKEQKMSPILRRKGSIQKEALLALAIVTAAAAILIPIAKRSSGNSLLLNESGRMRKVYVALTLYEEQFDQQPAPNLLAASVYDPNQADYASGLDPFVKSQPAGQGFPIDPGLDGSEKSPFRISFSYLPNFVRAGKLSIKPWAETRLDPKVGELADEWFGSVQAEEPYHAKVSGALLRINTDGAVYVLPDRGGPKSLGDPQDLFIKR